MVSRKPKSQKICNFRKSNSWRNIQRYHLCTTILLCCYHNMKRACRQYPTVPIPLESLVPRLCLPVLASQPYTARTQVRTMAASLAQRHERRFLRAAMSATESSTVVTISSRTPKATCGDTSQIDLLSLLLKYEKMLRAILWVSHCGCSNNTSIPSCTTGSNLGFPALALRSTVKRHYVLIADTWFGDI